MRNTVSGVSIPIKYADIINLQAFVQTSFMEIHRNVKRKSLTCQLKLMRMASFLFLILIFVFSVNFNQIFRVYFETWW